MVLILTITELAQLTMILKFSGLNVMKEYCRVWQSLQTSRIYNLIKWLNELMSSKTKGLKAKIELLQIHSHRNGDELRNIILLPKAMFFHSQEVLLFLDIWNDKDQGQDILRAQNKFNFHKKSLNWGQLNWIIWASEKHTGIWDY